MPDLSSVVVPDTTESVTVTATKPKAKPTPVPSLKNLEGQLVQESDTARAETDAQMKSVGQITSDFHSSLEELKKQAPKTPEDKPFQAPKEENPASIFGSKVGILAALASLATRRPLTSSLNAMAAGAKSIKDGNALAYKRSFDEWEKNSEHAFKMFDAENKSYNNLLDLAKTDYESAMSGVKTLAAMTNDKAMTTAAEMKGIEGVEQLNIERNRLGLEAQEAQAKMIPSRIFNQALTEYRVKNGKEPDANTMGQLWMQAQTGFGIGTKAGSGENGGDMAMVDAIAHYRAPPLTISTRNPQNKNIMEAVYALHPEYREAKYSSIKKAYADFSDGPSGKLITSGNVAIQHLGMLRDAAHALKNGDIQAFNAAKQHWLQATGSALPTNFDGISGIASDELVKFIVGGGKTGGALADRQEMKETLSRAASQGQLDGQMDSYIGLMAGQVAGQKKRYQEDGLEDMKPFNDWLLPETQNAIANHAPSGQGGGDFSHLWK